MAKTKTFEGEVAFLTLQIPRELMARIDIEVQRIRLDSPHQATSRAAVVRHALAEFFHQVDAQRRGEAA